MSTGRMLIAGWLALAVMAGGGTLLAYRNETPAEGRLVAFDLRTGALVADAPMPTESLAIHAWTPDAVVLSGADGRCGDAAANQLAFAYSFSRGAVTWTRPAAACGGRPLPYRAARGAVVMPAPSGRGLEAWDVADGSTRWRAGERRRSREPVGTELSPLMLDGDVSGVRVLDWGNGAVRRTIHLAPNYVPVQRAGERLVVAQGDRMAALELARGSVRWQRKTAPIYAYAPAAAHSDAVVARSWPGDQFAAHPIWHAAFYDAATGRRLWGRSWRVGPDALSRVSPLRASGAGVAVLLDGSRLSALDLASGRLRWRGDVDVVDPETVRVAAADGLVAFVDAARVTVLDAGSGHVRWTAHSPVEGREGHPGVPLIAGGRLLVPYEGWAFDPGPQIAILQAHD